MNQFDTFWVTAKRECNGSHATRSAGFNLCGGPRELKFAARRVAASAHLLSLVAGILLVGCSAGGAGGGGGARGELINLSACPANLDLAALAAEAITLTNEARIAAGAGAVTENAALTAAAQGHAQSMAVEGFTGHEHPVTGARVGDRVLAQGYNYAAVGENLEYGGCTAQWVVDEWLNSTLGHREILLDPVYTEIGIGVYQGGEEGMYWVQIFGAPL